MYNNAHQIVSDENGTLVSVTAKGLFLHLEFSHSQLLQVLGHIAAAFDIKVSFPRIFVIYSCIGTCIKLCVIVTLHVHGI